MEEKKLYTQEEVDLITGSIYAEAYNAGLNDNGYKPQPGAVWVRASERLPENDMFEDYPKEYCLKCKSDGSRGAVEYHQGNVDDIQYMVKCGPYDVIWWLDEEPPSEQPVAHNELQGLLDNCVEELQRAKRITGLVLQSRSKLWNDYAKLKAAAEQPVYTGQECLDTRGALRILLKLFRNGKLSEQQEKCCADAEAILKKYSSGRIILKEKPSPWISAATKPEHNVGVLVFIPGEDNHITSGMWDISNEWVLLDEYRTPEEEVTHWMPLPAFPEGYTWNEIPGELVDALKKVAKEELSKRATPAAAREEGKLTQSRADLIREANNRDLGGTVAAREEDGKAQFDALQKWLSEGGYSFDGEYYYDDENNFFTPDQIWDKFTTTHEPPLGQ